MTIRKEIIKMNHIESVIKVVNTSNSKLSTTISLLTDLKKQNETVISTPLVSIGTLEWSVAESNGTVEISRGDSITHLLYGSSEMECGFGSDPDQSAENITISMNSGVIVIRMLKLAGYRPKFKPEQDGGKKPTFITVDNKILITNDTKQFFGA